MIEALPQQQPAKRTDAEGTPATSLRNVVVLEYVSLDGVVQAPGHAGEDDEGGFAQGGWTGPFMRDHRRYIREAFWAAGAVLLGRRTYEIFAAYWPTVTDERDEIATSLNTLPKYVVSSTLTEAQWPGTTVIRSDVAEAVATLKTEPGKDMLVVGSSRLVQTLTEHDLVDEYRLWLHPTVLGRGKRLFKDGGPIMNLDLMDARTTTTGLVILTYERPRVGGDRAGA